MLPFVCITRSPLRGRALGLLLVLSVALAACAEGAFSTGTPAPSAAVGPSPTRAPTDSPPSPTLTSSPRPPTATPTAQNKLEPTLGAYGNLTPPPAVTLATPNPTPVGRFKLDENIINILLIGTDYRASIKGLRTDTLIIVSINKKTGLVSMLSIPRDLYVYVPRFGLNRINVAYDQGERYQYPGGGPSLLIQTILYNLGVPVHFYAVANFDGFRQIVNTVGGVDVPVNCQLTEYKLKDWSLDESDPANYELTTIPIGVTHMDGDLALFYARARPVGGDFFRSYRQRQVLRALYHTALNANIIPQLPALYGDFKDIVQTDMGLGDMMQFIPLALKLEDTHLRSFTLGPNQTSPWRTPQGEDVLLPRPGPLYALLSDFLDPEAVVAESALVKVEIWNLSSHADLETLAAETLRNAGFVPVSGTPDGSAHEATTLIDFTDGKDEAARKALASLVHVDFKHVVAQPDPLSQVAYRLIITDDYNACPRLDWMDPLIVGTATPAPTFTPRPAPTETPLGSGAAPTATP